MAVFTYEVWVDRREFAKVSFQDPTPEYLRAAAAAAVLAGLTPSGLMTARVRDSLPHKGETPDGVIITIEVQCEDVEEPLPAMAAAFDAAELAREALLDPAEQCRTTGVHSFLPMDSEQLRSRREATATCLACGEVIAAADIAAQHGLAWCVCGRWESKAVVAMGCPHDD